jgi:hypothetical protein
MQAIGDYMEFVKLILGESARYFACLLFAILAIRLWRRAPRLKGANKQQTLLLAGLASAASCAIGYLSMNHSLGLLYSNYGMKAFRSGQVLSAASLFHTSAAHWKTADAVGKEGACLLLLGNEDQGPRLLAEAKTMRKGNVAPFEQHYEGLFYFFHDQPDKAYPLLEASSSELLYRWDAIKLLCVILLEKNQGIEAANFMAPFAGVKIEDCDHAYVVASLKLLEGKKSETEALLDAFPPDKLAEFWKTRFEKLRAKTQKLPSNSRSVLHRQDGQFLPVGNRLREDTDERRRSLARYLETLRIS